MPLSQSTCSHQLDKYNTTISRHVKHPYPCRVTLYQCVLIMSQIPKNYFCLLCSRSSYISVSYLYSRKQPRFDIRLEFFLSFRDLYIYKCRNSTQQVRFYETALNIVFSERENNLSMSPEESYQFHCRQARCR